MASRLLCVVVLVLACLLAALEKAEGAKKKKGSFFKCNLPNPRPGKPPPKFFFYPIEDEVEQGDDCTKFVVKDTEIKAVYDNPVERYCVEGNPGAQIRVCKPSRMALNEVAKALGVKRKDLTEGQIRAKIGQDGKDFDARCVVCPQQ